MFPIFIILTVLYSTPTTSFTYHKENNACPRLLYYPVKAFTSRCYYNPNVLSSTPEMIQQNGYKCGTYKVVTDDGYTSLMFRVLPQVDDGGEKGQPIVLEHGVQVNSAVWTWMGDRSLAFVLARAGYDVWLVNQRDSGYTTHNKYKTSDSRFWASSLDDMASKGVPAILNTVATATNKSGSVIYIGHSRGSILGFMYASEYPDEAQKFLRGVVALAPVAYFDFSLHFRIVAYLAPIILPRISVLNYPVKYSIKFYQILCTNLPHVCELILLAVSGSVSQFLPDDLLAFFSIFPVSLSSMQVSHIVQLFRSGRFQKYDYGRKENLLKYGQEVPPLYNLSNFKLPAYLFYGKKDVFMKEKSVKRTFEEIGSSEKGYFSVPIGNDDTKLQFGHNDFILSRYIEELFYKDLLKVLKKLKPKE